ncbi:response regulator transcription factor [Cohnella sp. 56]|uniref:response regulator transcription factor n=1 Tax=Cohnella sp. 56 TaxID=3113722 RepID=UPI0030E84F97
MVPPYAILLVDDQTIETQTIRKLIEIHRLPLRVSTAANGEEALAHFRRDSCEILFTDIKMPRMNGLDLARHAKLLNPAVQLVIYSAFGEFEYAKEAIGLGAIHYLLKPLDIEEFLAVMDKAIGLAERAREAQADSCAAGDAESGTSAASSDEASGDGVRKVIRDVRRLVQEEYGNADLNIDYLAAKVFLSASYLGHLFKADTGENLGKHIIRIRMEQASRLLASTHLKVADVGQSVGYGNPSYFSMLFKMHFGCSPAQYREKGIQP